MEDLKNVAPLQEFDWDAFENGSASTGMSKEQLEQAYDNTLNKVADNEVVNGIVTAINKREVIVNIGYKSDGIIPVSEFRYNPDLKVGDEVEVYIENTEDKKGQLYRFERIFACFTNIFAFGEVVLNQSSAIISTCVVLSIAESR